jgi:Holliday junction DNA helicase RuvA
VRGTLVAKRSGEVLVDVQGVIFRVQTSATTLQELGEPGDLVSLVTHLIVREDELALYGFATEAELELFLSLLAVSGVGPRGALSLLSLAAPDRLTEWIRGERIEELARAPGIGKKTASRIVLELRGRLPALTEVQAGEPIDQELVAALQALGYTAQEARQAATYPEVRRAPSLEERIVAALRQLAPP